LVITIIIIIFILMLIIIQKIREHHTRKPRSLGTTENCRIGRYTHTSESADVKKYIRDKAETSDMGAINRSDRLAATLYSLGTWFVSGIYV
jgi:hypothetical protein